MSLKWGTRGSEAPGGFQLLCDFPRAYTRTTFWGCFILGVSMFTRSLVAVAIAAASVSAFALPGSVGKGPNVTYGYNAHGVNLHSLSNNPAQGFYVMPEEDRLRMGGAGSVSLGYEMGEVDNFLDRLDDILDDLERDDIGVAEGITLANEMNDVLVQMGRDGYARINTGLQMPLTPIAFRTALGTFSVSIEADAEVKASVLDDAVTYDAVNQELRTRSSLYLKSATFAQVGVCLLYTSPSPRD